MDKIDMNDYVLEDIDWDSEDAKAVLARSPEASFGPVSQKIRQGVAEKNMCALFCGGKKCKYCNCDHPWREDQMAFKGLYSNWITDNILAMSRLTTRGIEKHSIIDQFKEAGIRSVINTQTPGEHATCGDGLEGDQFSYRPEHLMQNKIFFYNFAWPDYSVGNMQTIVDIVRVMQFAVSEGKVAVHCHAGLGRTGVLIAAYLIFNNRLPPDEAVHYIRSKRPKSIQTSTQIAALRQFAEYLQPFRIIYSGPSNANSFTLGQFVGRQKNVLHGFEARNLKYIPKIIYVCCERLIELAFNTRNRTIHGEVAETRKSLSHITPLVATENSATLNHHQHQNGHINDTASLSSENGPGSSSSDLADELSTLSLDSTVNFDPKVYSVAHALSIVEHSEEVREEADRFKVLLNTSDEAWMELSDVSDPCVACELLWQWLDQLQEAAITLQNVNLLVQHMDDPEAAFKRLDKAGRHTTEYILRTLARLQPMPDEIEDLIVPRLIAVLTHHNIYIDHERTPPDLPKRTNSSRLLKGETLTKLMQLFYERLDQIESQLQAKTNGQA